MESLSTLQLMPAHIEVAKNGRPLVQAYKKAKTEKSWKVALKLLKFIEVCYPSLFSLFPDNEKRLCEGEKRAQEHGFSEYATYLDQKQVYVQDYEGSFKWSKKYGMWEFSLGCVEKFLTLDRTNLAALSAIGIIYSKCQDNEKAKHAFKRVFESLPFLRNMDGSYSNEMALIEEIYDKKGMIIRTACFQDLSRIEKFYEVLNFRLFCEHYYELSEMILHTNVSQQSEKDSVYAEEGEDYETDTIREVYVFQLPHSLKPKGFLLLEFYVSQIPFQIKGQILDMVIAEKYRKKGYGHFFLQFAKQRSIHNHAVCLNLRTIKSTIGFYVKEGFIPYEYLKINNMDREKWDLIPREEKITLLKDWYEVMENADTIKMKLEFEY